MNERALLPSSSSSSREASESSDSDGYLNVLRSLVAAIITEGSGYLNSQVQTCWKGTSMAKKSRLVGNHRKLSQSNLLPPSTGSERKSMMLHAFL